MALELFSAAAQAGEGAEEAGFPDWVLRFTLVYSSPPDLAGERQRLQHLFGGTGFTLRPAGTGEDRDVLLLEFPGLAREQSAAFLFESAQQLVDALGLVARVPDADPTWTESDELARELPESVSGIIRRLCQSSAAPPADPQWAVNMIKAPQAWSRFAARGQGILIAQPDTGVADHREIDQAVDRGLGEDLLAGGGPPSDPLSASMFNPGHGTATSSCVASRQAGLIVGSAPAATVVPMRCVNGVVLKSGAAVAAAVDRARAVGCHVVSMSLGGPIEFPDLKRAIRRAVQADMIVLAAAGNCVRLVVYPAWDPAVIAVAGVDEHGRPWRGTSRGRKVDVAAPAENVFVARRSTPADADLELVGPGQGTSFAVALTAGCAALWLSHHGPDAIKARARACGTNVQELFRAAVRSSARAFPSGTADGLGAGILDAETLLSLPLDRIVPAQEPDDANPGAAMFPEVAGSERFAAEAGFLAIDAEQRGNPARATAVETVLPPPASVALRARLGAGADRRRLERRPPPAVIRTPLIAPSTALRRLAGATSGGETEAAGGGGLEAVRRSIASGSGELARKLNDRLEAAPPTDDADLETLRGLVRQSAKEALNSVAHGAVVNQLPVAQRVAIEAIIRLEGRPVLRVGDEGLDYQDPALGDWARYLIPTRRALKEIFSAVGRIDREEAGEQVHVGTGSVVAPGLVMTNRHVIEAFADPVPRAGGGRSWVLRYPVSINFADSGMGDALRFTIKDIAFAGPDPIGRSADVAKLDLAILEVQTSNAAGAALPAPVQPPLGALDAHAPLLIVGYPAAPGYDAAIDPLTGKTSIAIWDRLWELFGDEFGVKYASPGDIAGKPGELAGDEAGWCFSHTATTLGGSSGSPAFGLGQLSLQGLHFGGAPLRQNLAHSLSAVGRVVEAKGWDPAFFSGLGWR